VTDAGGFARTRGQQLYELALAEKRWTEERLRDREAFIRAATDMVSDGVLMVDVAGSIESANPAAAHMFGVSLDDLRGKTITGLVPELELRASVSSTCERVGRKADGTNIALELTVSELRLSRTRSFVLVCRDVSERKRKDELLRQAQRLEAVGTMASGIAHDFNNLLMGISGFAHLAARRLDPEHPAFPHVLRSLEVTMRGSSLTRRLLRFSGARPGDEHGGPVELDVVVGAVRDLLRGLVSDHVRLDFQLGSPGVRVLADAGEIDQVLMNLVSNARDAMPDGGEVVVRTSVCPAAETDPPDQDRWVALSVVDNGLGMDAATLSLIFEPFFTTKSAGRGTGLGLATVQSVVTRLGGKVRVDSKPGTGTTVTLLLPISDAVPAAKAPDARDARRVRETVLLVEDDPVVRITVASYLEELGHSALPAADATEALRIAGDHTGRIDVLLTDVSMPGKRGRALARELVARRPHLKVLFMSAHPCEELLRTGRFDAHDRFVAKPFGIDELATALTSLVDGGVDAAVAIKGAGGSRRRELKKPARTRRVLVLDDDRDAAEILGQFIEFKGHRVAVANNARQAIDLARSLSPQVVFCDLDLGPGGNGYDVARTMRADAGTRGACLIALTGRADEGVRAAAAQAGFDGVVAKPADPIQVENVIQRGIQGLPRTDRS
jgi:PAS domain S-box-containing protein